MTTIATELWNFEVVEDATLVRSAIFTAAIVDEVSGAEPRNPVTIRTNREVAYARAASGSMLSISGRVEHLFPDLATKAYPLDITISTSGYRPHTRTETIPIAASFPIDLGTIRLRPYPVRVEGRVTKESDRTPIATATISLVTPKTLLLRTPAYYDHPIGTSVTLQTLTPGAAVTLAEQANAGALTFFLSSAAGIAANDLLLFGGSEYGIVASVDALADSVTLQHPLRRSYAKTESVETVAVAPGASTTLARDVNAGDGVLLLNGTLAGNAVAIGAAPVEYHQLGVVPDAEGFYSANGIGGLRELTFRATAGGFADLDVPLTIDYASPVNPSSFRLRP